MSEFTSFTKPIKIQLDDKGRKCVVLENVKYIRKDNEGEAIVIPKGFESDGLSGNILPRFGRGLKCALLHDYLCAINEGHIEGKSLRRKDADLIFLEAMLEVKAFCKPKCFLVYYAVRFYSFIKGYK